MKDPRQFVSPRKNFSIATTLKGVHYRSRLEARWSIFFGILDIPYLYEPRVFKLGWCYYLPDFYIPSIASYIEIKGRRPTKVESMKAQALAKVVNKDVYIFWGSIQVPTQALAAGINDSAYLYRPSGEILCSQWWGYCDKCHTYGVGQFCGHTPDPYARKLLTAYLNASEASFKKKTARRKG